MPAGLYNDSINVSTAEGKSDTAEIFIRIPTNLTWSQSPSEISKTVIQGTSGDLGAISLSNTGNIHAVLNVYKGPEGQPQYFGVNKDTVALAIGGSGQILVNYTAPVTNELLNLMTYVRTNNYTDAAGNQTKQTLLNLSVHPYFIDIISPTSASPVKNVSPGDIVQLTVNLSYGNRSLNSSDTIGWNITLSNVTSQFAVAISSVNYTPISGTEGYWSINLTAPSLPIRRGYNLNVTANYTMNGTNISLFSWDYEYKAVIYVDPEPPDILIDVADKVSSGLPANIRVNITDAGGVKNASATVQHHNITEPLNLTLIGYIGDTYMYTGQFTNTTEKGDYNITVDTYDMSDNYNTSSRMFQVAILVSFHGIAVDEERLVPKPALSVIFNLSHIETGLSYNFTTDVAGLYNKTIDAGLYNVNLKVWNETVDVYNLSLMVDVYDPFVFGNIPVTLIGLDSNGRGPLRGVTIDKSDNLSVSTVRLIFNYTSYESAIRRPKILGVYHCSNWTRRNSCGSSWARISDVEVYMDNKTVQAYTTSLNGGYAVAEYICGNGDCETGYGESTGNCPQDCVTPPQPPQPPSPPVSPGAGAAAGAGAGAGAAVGPPAAQVPVEIKSQLIFVTLRPGEHEIHSIDITNNLPTPITVDVSATGNAWELVMIEKPVFDIRGSSTGTVKIKVFALPTTMEGIYTGDIITKIREKNITHVTPITVKVEKPKEPLLDVGIKAISKTVEPGTKTSSALPRLKAIMSSS
jgi:hypothetical protein